MYQGLKTDYTGSGLEELRAQTVRDLIYLLLIVAAGLATLVAAVPARLQLEPALPFIGLLVTAALSYQAVRRGATVGAWLLLIGSGATLLTAVYAFPGNYLAAAYPLLVVVSATLLGWPGSVAVGLSASLVILAVASQSPNVISSDAADGLAFLNLAAVVVGNLLVRPVTNALAWALMSYEQAIQKTAVAQTRQAELTRVSKSLTDAYLRLGAANEELERARKAAVEAQRLKTEFSTTLSHELRTPLNLIIGFSELLIMHQPRSQYLSQGLTVQLRGDLESIHRNACHLSNLIDDVLELSQMDAHRLGLQRERVPLATIVSEAVGSVEEMFRESGLAITTDLPPDLPVVYVDRVRVRQVLINLLANAVRFTVQGGVRISAALVDRDVVVRVADTGAGINPEDLASLFEEFRQISRDNRQRHSGLGLAISKRFVELHGGAMWATSALGEGTTFHFSLPLAENLVALGDQSKSAVWAIPRESTRPAVLVLGDDPQVTRIFQRHLDGYDVLGADSADEAIQVTRKWLIRAVIITDHNGTAEEWLHHEGLQTLQQLPTINCSVRTNRSILRELGAAGYLAKPVSYEQLRDTLQRLDASVLDVLIVDDDPEMLAMLTQMVHQVSSRYYVRRAENGAEAMQRMAEKRPDLVFLDLLMPIVNGYAVLEAMRTNYVLRDVPVVVVSSRNEEEPTFGAESLEVKRLGGLNSGELVEQVRATLNMFLDSTGPVPARSGEPEV